MDLLCKCLCVAAHWSSNLCTYCTFSWLTASAPSGAEACCFSCTSTTCQSSQHTHTHTHTCTHAQGVQALFHKGLFDWAPRGQAQINRIQTNCIHNLKQRKIITYWILWIDEWQIFNWPNCEIKLNWWQVIFSSLMVYYCTCVAYFCCGSSDINRQRRTHGSLNYHEYLIRGRKWEKETKLKLDTIIEAYWDRWRGSSCAVFSLLAVSIFVSISKWTLISWRQWCVEACFLFLPVLLVLALHLMRSGKPLCSFCSTIYPTACFQPRHLNGHSGIYFSVQSWVCSSLYFPQISSQL